MLKSIQIENVALIDKIEIDFCKNLNVLSGETGAGKSIIIDALNFVVGGKTLKTLIKQNCDYMKVCAVFSCPKNKEVKDILNSFDAYDENEVVILRKMQKDGRVDSKINGVSVPSNTLKTLTAFLIDIHGQHEHQKILHEKNHIILIDGFLENKSLKSSYKMVYQKLKEINAKIEELNGSTQNQERLLDLYGYQINEIENANIKDKEDEILSQKKFLMQNSEKIFDLLNSSLEHLNGQNSVVDILKKTSNDINSIIKYDNSLNALVGRLDSCKFEILDIISIIKDKLSECDFNSSEYEEIDARLDKLKTIKKKYGPTLEEVFSFLDRTKLEYEKVLNSKDKLKELIKQKEEILQEAISLAKKLNKERLNIAKKFEKDVKAELKDLGMKNSNFVVEFNTIQNEENFEESLNELGFDKIKFMFSANIGQNLKPLSEIISGGEASRFMLAIKNILADVDGTPSMVFDEIDTGISGEMGYMVACKMANISRKHQIMAISHLPQICAMADENVQVYKFVENEKTHVSVSILAKEDVLNEIARLSGGVKNNAVSLEHAKELKTRCNEYKKSLIYNK